MRRRAFFGALFTATAAPVVPHRVYSFLWDKPRVKLAWEIEGGFPGLTGNGGKFIIGGGPAIYTDDYVEQVAAAAMKAQPTLQDAYNNGAVIDIPPRLAKMIGDNLLKRVFHEPRSRLLFPERKS